MAASGDKTRGCPRNEKVAVWNTTVVVWEMALARWALCNHRQGRADGSCGNECVWAHKTSVLFPWLVIITVLHLISNLACCHGSLSLEDTLSWGPWLGPVQSRPQLCLQAGGPARSAAGRRCCPASLDRCVPSSDPRESSSTVHC